MNYHIVKGRLDSDERAALEQVLDGIAARAEAQRNLKPHTRGLWGRDSRTLSPLGFRNPPLPRS